MVTAGNGTLRLKGASGREYSYSFYSSDVIGAFCTFNTSAIAVAGSQTFFITPENCRLIDVSFTSTNTVATAWQPQINDTPAGSVVSIANCLNTLQNRSFPMLTISGGRKFTLLQQ